MLTDFRLEVFLAVASCGSFTLAARKLGISQPAVSQHIRELEQETGEALFIRTKGSALLTEKGVLLAEYAERILKLYARARRSVIDGLPDTQAEAEVKLAGDEIIVHIKNLHQQPID